MADLQTTLFSLCVIIIPAILFWIKSSRAKSPPGPFALPIIGHLHLLAPSPHEALHKLSLKYGPVFQIFLGSVPCVVASSSETAKEFLKTNEHAILDRALNSATEYFTYGYKDYAFAPHGSYWKFMKKLVMTQLLSKATVDSLLPVRQDEINCFINSLSQHAKLCKTVDLRAELMMVTNNVVSRTLMSTRCSDKDGDAREVRNIVTEMTNLIGNFNLADYIWFFKLLDVQGFGKKLKNLRTRFDVLIERIIKEHEEARKKDGARQTMDILNILLDIAEDENAEIKLTRENIKGFLLDVVLGGTDTAAVATEWTLSELINHPNIMEKAIQEIHQVVGKNRVLQESDIPNLPYLQAIVKESLRLHPPVPLIPRRSTQDCIVAGYHIASKSTILIHMWSLGRDPKYWENPLEFRPERFVESQLDVKGNSYEMLPFGSGRRMCPGISLTMQLVPALIGAMIQCFEWKHYGSLDMKEGFGITMHRANPLVCVPVATLDPIPFSI